MKLVEEQVEELLNKEELDHEELSILEETIDQVNMGEVKGETEYASTSVQVVEEDDKNNNNSEEIKNNTDNDTNVTDSTTTTEVE